MTKRLICILAVSLMIFGLSNLIFAQDEPSGVKEEILAQMPPECRAYMEKMSPGKKHHMPHKDGMMKPAINTAVVATQDGGVVVLAGNKLIKYDKDLNLVKEVQINIDTEGMHKMMKDFPMKKMMQEVAPEEDASIGEANTTE